ESQELREDPSELVRDVHRGEAITLFLECEVSRGSVRERREPRRVVRRHPLRDEPRGQAAKDIARPARRHPWVPGVVELEPRPVRDDVHMALEEDRGSEGLRRFPVHVRALHGGVGQGLAYTDTELEGYQRDDLLRA